MPALDVNLDAFSRLPSMAEGRPFESAFPSSDAQGSARFQAIAKEAKHAGHMAKSGANAWQFLQQLQLREVLTSSEVGGYPMKVIGELLPDGVNAAPLRGALATVSFSATTDVGTLRKQAMKVGLGVLKTALSAIPLVGGALGGVVDMAVWLFALGRQSEELIVLTVPWVEYSRDSDEDIVNQFILPRIAPSPDWTSLFEPPFQTGFRPFTAEKTERKGETRAFGVWSTNSEPIYAAGAFGFMPGCQQLADLVQVARIAGKPGGALDDAVTNVGDYLPSVSQYGQQVWGQCLRLGNPDAFKIQPAQLAGQWRTYWDAFYGGAIEQIRDLRGTASNERTFTRLAAAKAFARFMVTGWTGAKLTGAESIGLAPNFVAHAGNLFTPIDVDGFGIFDNEANSLVKGSIYRRIDDAFILPGLRTCQKRQKNALATTNVAALVRPIDGPDGEAFAAFKDEGPPLDSKYESWGEELRDFCLNVVRPRMLTHDIKWTVSDADARAVDGRFADDLKRSKAGETPPHRRQIKKGDALVITAVVQAAAAEPNAGGSPFAVQAAYIAEPRSRLKMALAIAGGTAVVGGVGYGIWRATRGNA